jgi:excisionase family DNA binding protein
MSRPTNEPPRLLSIEQAAHILGIGRSTAYELVRLGQLRSLKIGSRRLVPREAIDDVIRELGGRAA